MGEPARQQGLHRKTGLKRVSGKRSASGQASLARGGPLRQVSARKATEGSTSTFKPRALSLDRGCSTFKPRTDPARTSSLTASTPRRRRSTTDGFTAATRGVIFRRVRGLCEACGLPLGPSWDAHHRRRRQCGDHSPANGVALHPTCHTVDIRSVHQRPAWSRARGLIVHHEGDAAASPMTLPSGRRVLLHPTEPRYLDAPAV